MYEAALVLSVLCFLAVTLVFSRSRAFSVFHPLTFYLAFHGFIFVFRPIVAYFLDFRVVYTLYRFFPSLSDKLTVIIGSNVGLLAFAFFAMRAGNVEMRFGQDRFAVDERNRLIPAALWTFVIVTPIGIYSLLWRWTRAATDLQDMVMDKGTGAFVNTAANGYLADAQFMLATACAMLGWLFRFRLIALMPLAAFILFRAGTGGRGAFVTAAVCLGLLWLYERRERLPNVRTIMAGVLLVLMFTVVGADRGRAIRQFVGGDDTTEMAGSYDVKFLEGMDYANLEYFEFLVYAVPQRTGSYDYFADHLMLFTEPVPRVLWAGKPVGSPVQFFKLFDYGYPVGMTRSLPGEGWTGLGWLGIIFWCGLWGHVLGLVYRRFVVTGQDTFGVLAYMMLLGILVVAYRDGTVITIARSGLFYFAPIALWIWFANMLGIPRAKDFRVAYNREVRAMRAGLLPPGAAPPDLSVSQASGSRAVPHGAARRRSGLAGQNGEA